MDCSAEGLLRCLLRACHSSHGLLALRPTDDAAGVLQQLRSRVTTLWGSQQVRWTGGGPMSVKRHGSHPPMAPTLHEGCWFCVSAHTPQGCGCLQVEPHTAPEAAAALHSMAERLTRSTAQRLGMHSYELHPFCNDLPDWLHPADDSKPSCTHSV